MKIRSLRQSQIILGFLLPILFSQLTYAYETATHEKLSEDSINISVLAQDAGLLVELGINGNIFDGLFPSILPRNADTPDESIFDPAASIRAIIAGGAVLEDAFPLSLGHFFDPRHDRAITVVNDRSPDWILEVDAQGNRLDLSLQKFSYADAIDYFYSALRGQDELNNPLTLAQRNEQFGFMFRSLGHVIHHIQDMAQPQHVRHDAHCKLIACVFVNSYNPSWYEAYTNRDDVRDNLVVSGYPAVVLNNSRDFWTTSLNTPENGRGLADFTNANFFSQGTNLVLTNNVVSLNAPYPLPTPLQDSNGDVIFERVHLSQLPQFITPARVTALNCDGDPHCVVEFVKTDVIDNFDPAQNGTNDRASSVSVFDKHLFARNAGVIRGPLGSTGAPYFTDRLFALNQANFAKAHEFLIKRAVSYSAGLINHFFRGRLQVVSTATNSTNQIEVTIKNVSSTGNDFINRNFEVHYDKDDGTRAAIFGPAIVGGPAPVFAVNDTVTIAFTPPADVDPTKSKPYAIVYNDQIGQEKGVAGVGFDSDEFRIDYVTHNAPAFVDNLTIEMQIHGEGLLYANYNFSLDPSGSLSAGAPQLYPFMQTNTLVKIFAPNLAFGHQGQIWLVAHKSGKTTSIPITYNWETQVWRASPFGINIQNPYYSPDCGGGVVGIPGPISVPFYYYSGTPNFNSGTMYFPDTMESIIIPPGESNFIDFIYPPTNQTAYTYCHLPGTYGAVGMTKYQTGNTYYIQYLFAKGANVPLPGSLHSQGLAGSGLMRDSNYQPLLAP